MRAVFTADWHLRWDRPKARTDDRWDHTQALAIETVCDEARKRKCPVYLVGDLFHRPREPNEAVDMLVSTLYENQMTDQFFAIPGNHDLLYHQFVEGTAFRMALLTPAVRMMMTTFTDAKMKLLHTLVFETAEDRPHPDAGGITAAELLEQHPDFDWLITGDNHQCFHYEEGGRHVINPGCLLRQKASEIEYTPSVWYVDTEIEEVERIEIPDPQPECITRVYLELAEIRNESIAAFVEKLKSRSGVTLDFRANIDAALKNKDVPEAVGECVVKIMEDIRQ